MICNDMQHPYDMMRLRCSVAVVTIGIIIIGFGRTAINPRVVNLHSATIACARRRLAPRGSLALSSRRHGRICILVWLVCGVACTFASAAVVGAFQRQWQTIGLWRQPAPLVVWEAHFKSTLSCTRWHVHRHAWQRYHDVPSSRSTRAGRVSRISRLSATSTAAALRGATGGTPRRVLWGRESESSELAVETKSEVQCRSKDLRV
jgi:hypothetical protein